MSETEDGIDVVLLDTNRAVRNLLNIVVMQWVPLRLIVGHMAILAPSSQRYIDGRGSIAAFTAPMVAGVSQCRCSCGTASRADSVVEMPFHKKVRKLYG